MTVKLLVLYTQPENAEEFDQYYLDVHMPLVARIPGLEGASSCRVAFPADGGETTYYRSAELLFADVDALNAGLGSDEGKAAAADYGKIAPPGSRMFVATVD